MDNKKADTSRPFYLLVKLESFTSQRVRLQRRGQIQRQKLPRQRAPLQQREQPQRQALEQALQQQVLVQQELQQVFRRKRSKQELIGQQQGQSVSFWFLGCLFNKYR